jgi:DNA-binding NarL/FixJ family response regulator
LVAQGQEVAQIAAQTHVSESTVRNHKGNLVAKLGLTGCRQLYLFAGQHQVAIAAKWENAKGDS